MTIKIYLAGGFFNKFQTDVIDYLENFLDKKDAFVFSPRRETKLEGFENSNVQQKVFEINLENIKKSDIIIASTVDKDMGTVFECGYGFANNIPIIYTLFDERLKDFKFNLMLAKSGVACFVDKEKFEKYIDELVATGQLNQSTYEGEFE